MPSFNDFSLQPTTYAVLAKMEITEPTPIQAGAIPALLAGRDLVGQSTTGSGKTLAYSIPVVERLSKDKRVPQALILVPTRELAVQVNAVISKLATSRRLTTALLVGGRPYGNQISALRYGAQIVVGTPGRIKDHLERGSLVLNQLRICILDEADQMLDSGFAPVIEEILTTTPETRQMAFFSATIPDWVAQLQKKFLKDPIKIDITSSMSGPSTIEQIAYQVQHDQKIAALCTLLRSSEGESTLIFGRTKFGVEKLGKQLSGLGFAVGTLHGNKSQRAREDVLAAFRHGHVQTLLATNVAARGLDIQGIYQVINYELPESSELFTHRIGRTGRMGRQGKAITLLVPSDLPKWRRMVHTLGQTVPLQRLVINEEAMFARPLAKPEMSVMEEREQQPTRTRKSFSSEQGAEPRVIRERRPFSPEQERSPRPVREHRSFSPEQGTEPRVIRERRPFSPEQERSPRPVREHRSFSPEQGTEPRVIRERRPFSPEQERSPRPVREHRSFSPEPRVIRERRPFSPEQERSPRPVREHRSFSPEQGTEPRVIRERRPFSPEQERSPRPVREHRPFTSSQERERLARPKSESLTSGLKNLHASSETLARTPEWQTEGFTPSERPSTEPERDSRKEAGKPSSFGRTPSKRKPHPFTTTESQHQPARRKSGAPTSVARPRRSAAPKRSTSR